MKRMRTVLAVFLTLTLLLSMFCQPLEAAGINLAVGGKSGTGTSIVMPTAGLLQGLTGLMGKLGGGVQKISNPGIAPISEPGDAPEVNGQMSDLGGDPSITLKVTRGKTTLDYTPNMELKEGDSLSLSLYWGSIPPGTLSGKTVVYELGDDLNIKSLLSGSINMDGTVAGTYLIKDGKLYITFNENADGKSNRTLNVGVSCDFGPPEKEWADKDPFNFEFGSETFNFTYSDDRSDLSAKKVTTEYTYDPDAQTFKARNTITVTVFGQVDNITVTDTTADDVHIKGDVTMTYTPGSSNHKNEKAPSSETFTPSADGFEKKYDGTFYNGDQLTFTYETELGKSGNLNGTFSDLIWHPENLKNSVSCKYQKKTQSGKDFSVKEDSTYPSATKPSVSKTGTIKTGSDGKKYIEWTIKINIGNALENLKENGSLDLNKLKERLGATDDNLVAKLFALLNIQYVQDIIDEDSKDLLKFMGDVVGEDGKIDPSKFTLNFNEYNLSSSEIYVKVNTSVDDQTLFTKDEITKLHNKAVVKYGDHDDSDVGEVEAGTQKEVVVNPKKEFTGTFTDRDPENSEVKNVYFKWRITYTLPESRVGDYTITETTVNNSAVGPDGEMYKHAIAGIVVTDDVGNTYTEDNQYTFEHTGPSQKDGEVYEIKIHLNQVDANANTIYIDVKSQLVDKNGKVVLDVLKRLVNIGNTANSSEASHYDNSQTGGGVEKSGKYLPEENVIEWTVKGKEDFVQWLYDDKLTYSVTIEDTLAKELTYIPGSLEIGIFPDGMMNYNAEEVESFYELMRGALSCKVDSLPDGKSKLTITWAPNEKLLDALRTKEFTIVAGNIPKTGTMLWQYQNNNQKYNDYRLTFTFRTAVDGGFMDYYGTISNSVDQYVGKSLEGSDTVEVTGDPKVSKVLSKQGYYKQFKDVNDFIAALPNMSTPNEKNGETAQTDFKEETDLFNKYFFNSNGEANFFFTVDVNPYKHNFRNYMQDQLKTNGIVETSKIALVDTLGTSLSFLRNSLKIYSYTDNRYLTKGEYSLILEEVGGKQVATIVIPDAKHLRISYWAWLTTYEEGEPGENEGGKIEDAGNEIKLLGSAQVVNTGSENGQRSFAANASMNGNGHSFGIEKLQEDGSPLDGALFAVTAVKYVEGKFVPEEKTDIGPIELNDNSHDAYIEKEITEASKAMSGFDSDNQLHIYKLEEKKAPTGFKKIDPIYFVFEESYKASTDTALKAIVDNPDLKIRKFKDGEKITIFDQKSNEETGDLTIEKIVKINNDVQTDDKIDKEFTIKIDLGANAANKTYKTLSNGTLTFDENGVAVVKLKAGNSVTVTGIPVDTKYKVYEVNGDGEQVVGSGIVDGYTATYTVGENEVGKDKIAEGVISTDESKVTVTNSKNVTELTLKKLVKGETDASKTFGFNVTLKKDGNILQGVKYTKNGGIDEFDLDDTNGEITLKKDETVTFVELPVGTTYEINEKDSTGYAVEVSNDDENGKFENNVASGTANGNTVTFTNTKLTSLTLTKRVEGKDNDETEFTFNVTIKNDGKYPYEIRRNGTEEVTKDYVTGNTPLEVKLASGDTLTISDIPVDTEYEIKETPVKNYTSNYNSDTSTGTLDKDSTVTFVNTYTKPGTGSIKVTKKVDGGVDPVKDREFTFTITLTPDGISAEDLNEAIDVTNGNSAVDGNTVKVTGTVNANGFVEVKNIPLNTKYSVEEIGFDSNVFEKSEFDGSTTGTIDVSGKVVALTCTNTLKKGSLKVTKTVINTEDKDVFHFTVTLTDSNGNPISGEFSDIVFNEDGVGTFTLEANTSKTIEGLPVGTKYAVTETDANTNNYTTSYTDCEGVIGVGDKPAEAVVTNTKNEEKTGGLTVEKIVKINGVEKSTSEQFTITVTTKSAVKDGKYGEMTFTDGVATLTLTSGMSATATGLPANTEYTVAETNSTGYVATYSGSTTDGTGTITNGNTDTVTITNSKEVGDLSIQKTVSGNAADPEKLFEIDIQFADNTFSGTYDGVTFEGGKATIQLRHQQTKKITGLPANMAFTVTEHSYTSEGYVATYIYKANTSEQSEPTPGNTGVIPVGDTASVYITNTKDTFGSLTLTKHVAGENADPNKVFTFYVSFTGENVPAFDSLYPIENGKYVVQLSANSAPAVFSNLPVGTVYTISEADYSSEGYTGTVTEGTPIGVIVEGDTRVTYTNTKAATTSLMIRKELSGTAITQADAEMLFTFHVALTAPALGEQLKPSYEYGGKTATVDATGVYVVTLKGGEGFVFMNLPDGTTYTVTEVEANQNGFTTVIPDNASGALDTNSCPIVTFVNSKELRETSLTVRKTVQGDDADYSKAFNFTVTLEGYTGPYTLNGVEAVTENGIITFTLMSGQSVTIAGIPENTVYSVTELEANADGYVTNVNGSQNGVLTPDTESSVEFVNAKWKEAPKTGSLTVRKTVTGTAAEYGRRFSFTVMLSDTSVTGIYGQMNFVGGVASFALAHGESITATDLPAGITYTIFENDAGDYIQNSMGATGMITENGFAEAMFINTKDKEEKYGDLSVTKTVTGEGYDPAQQFNFTVTLSDSSVNGQYGDMNFVGGVASFTLTAGQTAYAAQLPADIFYTVIEEPTENYISTATGDSGAIVGDSMVYAEFVNEYVAPRVGGFNITKLVTGTAGDLNRFFTFRVVLSDASINGVYGDIAFADGFATVFLRSGMTVYCDGLPEGTGYSVIELDSDDYMVTYTNAAGTVEVGTSIPVTVINHKDIPDIPEEHEEEDQPNPHDDDMNAGVGGDRPHGDDMNAGVGGDRPHGDDMNPATGDFELEHYSNAFITITVLWAMVFIFGAVVLADKRRRDK